jgi:hypothetical protein
MAYVGWQARPVLDKLAGRLTETPEGESRLAGLVASSRNRRAAALVAWNLQAQLSTVALLSLLALFSVWTALAVMVVWSAISTVVYVHGRRRGLPDIFGRPRQSCRARSAVISLGQACVGGVQPFVYTRTLCHLIETPAKGLRSRVSRLAILGVGLTLFGVTATHHLLQRAGYEGRDLLHYSLLGAVLHAAYRILLSGALISAAVSLSSSVPVSI